VFAMMNSIRARPTPAFGSADSRNASAGLPTLSITAVAGQGSAARSTGRRSKGTAPR
jgi:hypothetical protein